MTIKCSEYSDEMIPMCGVGFLVGLMTGCVAPLYHRNTTNEDYNKNESNEDDSPEVHIKISRPHQCQHSNDTSSETCDRQRNSVDSNDAKGMKQVVQEVKPVSLEEVQIVPVLPPLNQHRTSRKFWSSPLRKQLENITSASSDISDGSIKVEQAQIEVNPRMYSSSSQEDLDSTKYKSFPPDSDKSLESVNNKNCLNGEKTKKRPSIVKKWKNLKKTLICTRNEKATVFKGFKIDESQRLHLASPASGSSVPVAQSTMLQKSRHVNISTSTRISSNILETRSHDDGTSAKKTDSNEDGEPENENSKEQPCPRTKALQEMVSLINRQSVDGKSICDVRINGLTMNQSDLLELFEATEGKARSVSMMTTEEAQIISIKFHRRRIGNGTAQNQENLQKQSGIPNLMIPPIYVSDYSINETSYKELPTIKRNAFNCPTGKEIRRNTFWKAKIT